MSGRAKLVPVARALPAYVITARRAAAQSSVQVVPNESARRMDLTGRQYGAFAGA
jgi:hypothetical protein